MILKSGWCANGHEPAAMFDGEQYEEEELPPGRMLVCPTCGLEAISGD